MFYNSDSLSKVNFPSTLTSIGDTAFRDCDGLLNVTIPAQLTSMGVAVFSDCKRLQNINVDAENPVYSSVGGVLFNKAQTRLICYPAGRIGSYTIPNGVTVIGYAAFPTPLSSNP